MDIKSKEWLYQGKIYCAECNKYRNIVNPKIWNVFDKTLAFSIICSNVVIIMIEYLKKKKVLRH